MAKNPMQAAKEIGLHDFEFDPFLYDYDEDEMEVYYDKGESHYPSEYEEGYADMEGMDDQLALYPTKKEGIYYLISNFMGDGFTTPENVAKYVKGSYPYNRQEWEKEMRGN